jgi:hypothetical protein
MKLSVVLMSIAALLLVGTANAAVKQGQMEVDALGGYTSLSGDGGGDLSAMFLMGRAGYFVTNNIQVSAVGMGAWIDTGGLTDDITVYAVGAAGKFHFMPDQQWVPYVGGQILYGTADFGTSANATIYGVLGGVRYEVTPTTDFFVEGQYNLFSGDLGDVIDNMYAVMFGFTHKWK